MQTTRLYIIVAGLLVASWMPPFVNTTPPANAGENRDLERFLPNDGNSVYEAAGLLRQWPPEGPKELWRVEIGWGKSAVVEAGGLAFTTAEIDEKQWAICLDPLTGATRWKHLLMPKKNRHTAWGPVTTPVIDGDRVYFIPYANHENDVWELRCPIVCLKTDGTELWKADQTFWATEASVPLVAGDTLYVAADNPQRAVLVALDKRTGKLRWSVKAEPPKDRELGAPASLTYQVVQGIPQVIVGTYGTRELLGVHAVTGEIMWRYPSPVDIIIGLISTPVAVGSRLFVCAGEGRGRNFSACLQMQVVDGKVACEELYLSTELQTNNYNTVAIHQDAVFGFGGNQRIGFLHCTNLEDGRLLWRHDSKDWSIDQNLIIADGLIFALTQNDELVMAEANRTEYRELGRVSLGIELGRPQQPTLANGRMYIRGKKSVVCYQIAEDSAPETSRFIHPGILHNRAEIDFVRGKIRAAEEPWKSAWESLVQHRFAQPNWEPKPHAHVARGAYNNPDVGASDMMNDSAAAYTQALRWVLSGEDAHAQKAIEILGAYSSTLKTVKHHDARLLAGMAGIHLINAAELIRHSDAPWDMADQKRFERLLLEVLYPVIEDFYPTANGNWDASMIQTMIAMGVFLDNRDIFDRGVNYYRHGKGNGRITHYFNELGQCQESGRDQGHTQMGLGYLGCAAEIAWKQGVDLYSAADSRLALGYEYTAKYNLGHDVPFQPFRSVEGRYDYKKISERGGFAPVYEIVYHHYHGRAGMEMPFTKQVIARVRPEQFITTHTPWATLMFAQLPSLPTGQVRMGNHRTEPFNQGEPDEQVE